MTISRRQFGKLVLGAGAVAPMGFVRKATAAPKPGDQLVVGVWGGVQERIVRAVLVAPLEAIRVQGEHGAGRHARAPGSRLRRAQPGRASTSSISPSLKAVRPMRDGVTQPPGPQVPQFAHLAPIARVGGYGVAINPITIISDKRKAKTPVTSWKDLWNPEWASPHRTAYPSAEGAAGLLMSAKVWGGDERHMDVAFDRIKQLKPFTALASSQDELFQMFDTGVCDIAIEFGSLSRRYAETRNPNLVVSTPLEGQAAAVNVACITTGAPNQKLAEEWINLHLSAPCMLAYARQTYFSPTVDNVAIPADLKPKLISPQDAGKLVAFDWDTVNHSQRAWANRFNREIAG